MQEREKYIAAKKSIVCCCNFLNCHHIAQTTNSSPISWYSRVFWAKENCKFSLKMPQGMQLYTSLLEVCWLTLSNHLEHGSRNLF